MSFFRTIKEIIFWEKDEEFFDKEATIKEYFAICPPDKRKHVDTYEDLYKEALRYVEKQSFEQNTKEQEDYFYEMNKVDASVSILVGVVAYVIAYSIDKNGKTIEKKIDKILPKGYDVNNPFDLKLGKNHRGSFGHDIFTFGLKNIPEDFPIVVDKMGKNPLYLTIGEKVGKKGNISMLDLIWKYYGETSKNPLFGIFNCLGHTIVHFAKDLLTPDGVPLPFTSLFNEYIYNGDGYVDKDTYIVKNKVNDKVNEVNGNMKASDFATLSFIKGMCKLYAHNKKLGDKEKSFRRDMEIMAMGTCMMLQMSQLVLSQDKTGMIPGAKMNFIMAGALFNNMIAEMKIVVKARKEVNDEYDRQLREVQNNGK